MGRQAIEDDEHKLGLMPGGVINAVPQAKCAVTHGGRSDAAPARARSPNRAPL